MIDLYKQECKKCGYKWMSKVPEPKACTRCKSYRYNTPNTYGKAKKV